MLCLDWAAPYIQFISSLPLVLHLFSRSTRGLTHPIYADFAAFGAHLDKRMALLRARRITPLVKGDEIAGSELAFKTYAREVTLSFVFILYIFIYFTNVILDGLWRCGQHYRLCGE